MVPIKRGEFVLEYRGEVRFLLHRLAQSESVCTALTELRVLANAQIISRNESYRRVLTDYKDSAS